MTYYYWDFDTDNVFLEEDENGNVIAEYTQEPSLYGQVIAQEHDGQVRYYNFDGQGSTRELTDENGEITDTFIYTAFGEEIARTGATETRFAYKGALGYYTNSDTNDIYVRERIYGPTNGRWLSEDPLLFSDGTNVYAFVGNSPLDGTDPSGMLRVETLPFAQRQCNDKVPAVQFKFHLEFKRRVGNKEIVGAPCAGYVVQKVSVTCFNKMCDCGCEVPTDPKEFHTFHYWEAWKVAKDDTVVTDNAYLPAWGKTCGKYTQKGEVRFYCRTRTSVPRGKPRVGTGPLEDKWNKRTFGATFLCSTTSIELPATDDPDLVKFWDEDPIEGPATREYELEWNCCVDPKKHPKIITEPSTT